MLIVQSVIVGVIYLVLGFLEEYLSFPMCSRPMVVGSVIGFFLGDLKTGVMIGASLELVFMGAVQIGASTPPDSLVGTAVGTAFAIIMHADVEVALAAGGSCRSVSVHDQLHLADIAYILASDN